MMEWIVSSSVLIVLVIALRGICKGKINLRLQYALWGLVLLRLLLPFSIGNTAISVSNGLTSTTTEQPIVLGYVGAETPDLAIAEPDTDLSIAEQEVQYEINRELWQAEMDAARAETGTPITLSTILMVVWGVGVGLVGLCFLYINLRFGKMLRHTRTALTVENCPRPVYVSEHLDTPCLFGLLRPAIYLTPEVVGDETLLHHTLAHELTHHRHGDHIWAPLRGLCLALHWYNPLVWWGAILSSRDGELACDEGTIRNIGEEERAQYGRTLIAMTCQKRTDLLLAATTMTGSKGSIKERITRIAKKPKMAIYTLVAVIVVATVAVGCTFTGASEDGTISDNSTPDVSQPFEDESLGTVEGQNNPSDTDEFPDVIDALERLTPEDFVSPVNNAEELINTLKGAIPHEISEEDAKAAGWDWFTLWWLQEHCFDDTLDNAHLSIYCGLAENIVEVTLQSYPEKDTVYFEDETLYHLVRHYLDYDEIIDPTAYAKFEHILVPQMELNLECMNSNDVYSGYELTRFNLVWSYDTPDGHVELYDFNYALLPDQDLRTISWAGGMYADSQLRIQGFNGGGQLGVKYVGDQVVSTAFMGNDFYYTPNDLDDIDLVMERLNTALALAPQSELSVKNIQNNIGTTLRELKSQYPNGEFLVRLDGFPDGVAACYGDEGGDYICYFFGGHSGDFEKAMDECEEQLRCAGFITTASALFPDMEDDMSLEDFFAFIGVDEYEDLEETTPITGWFKFMYRDMETWLDTNEPSNGGEGDTTGKIVKRNAIVSIVDPEIAGENQALADAVMFH